MTQHEHLKVLEWKVPPAPRNRMVETKAAKAAAAKQTMEITLKQRPGVWALVAERTYAKKGSEYANDPDWEVKRDYRYPDRNRFDLYLRWIGGRR